MYIYICIYIYRNKPLWRQQHRAQDGVTAGFILRDVGVPFPNTDDFLKEKKPGHYTNEE